MNLSVKALSELLKISDMFFLTNFQITLPWIENRLQDIRKLTNLKNWFYCFNKSNLADLLNKL